LLSSRLSESSALKKVQQLRNEISKLRCQNLRQEAKLDEKEQALSHIQGQLTSRCRCRLDSNSSHAVANIISTFLFFFGASFLFYIG
jgi:hypothetical protein